MDGDVRSPDEVAFAEEVLGVIILDCQGIVLLDPTNCHAHRNPSQYFQATSMTGCASLKDPGRLLIDSKSTVQSLPTSLQHTALTLAKCSCSRQMKAILCNCVRVKSLLSTKSNS